MIQLTLTLKLTTAQVVETSVAVKLISNMAYSLTWPASMQIYGNKRNFLHKKSPTPTGFAWNTNMAAVTSCEYALYDYSCFVMVVKITQVGIGGNTQTPLPLVLQFAVTDLTDVSFVL